MRRRLTPYTTYGQLFDARDPRDNHILHQIQESIREDAGSLMVGTVVFDSNRNFEFENLFQWAVADTWSLTRLEHKAPFDPDRIEVYSLREQPITPLSIHVDETRLRLTFSEPCRGFVRLYARPQEQAPEVQA